MKRYLVRDTTMTAIADAVRNKTGTSLFRKTSKKEFRSMGSTALIEKKC